jgi:hypothetical protein
VLERHHGAFAFPVLFFWFLRPTVANSQKADVDKGFYR